MEAKNQNTLIERYLAAVSDLLPEKLRKDTVTEIRSLIEDALEDRSKTEGRPPDDDMVAEVLKQFGSPEKIVAPYLPARYLIGPQLFPIFTLVLRIALPIVAVVILVTYWIGVNLGPTISLTELVASIAKSLGSAFSAVVQAFGDIVIIFAILQWTVPELRIPVKESESKAWDPRSLKAISQPDKIKRGEQIVEIVFVLLALIIFNFYLSRVGIYNNSNGVWTFTPILTAAFNKYIPWFDLLWILTIILDLLLVRRGYWQTGTRLFSIVVNALNIVIAASLITNFRTVYTLQGALGDRGWESIAQSILNPVLTVVFAIVIISNSVKIIQHILRIIRVRNVLPEDISV